jgi:hypothetical protein
MKLTTLIKYYLIKITIEATIRTFLIYIIMILIPSIILNKPVYIDRLFFEILIICIAASALEKYIISPILISLAYIYSFLNTVIRFGGGILAYEYIFLNFKITFSLDATLLLVVLFGFSVVPMCIIAFYSFFVTIKETYTRRPPMPLVAPTVRQILEEILS